MAGNSRFGVLDQLAQAILSVELPHPIRVAIDGRSGAGKTSLAEELAYIIRDQGRDVSRASIDDFHRPGHKFRSIRGDWTPGARYEQSYDYDAFQK